MALHYPECYHLTVIAICTLIMHTFPIVIKQCSCTKERCNPLGTLTTNNRIPTYVCYLKIPCTLFYVKLYPESLAAWWGYIHIFGVCNLCPPNIIVRVSNRKGNTSATISTHINEVGTLAGV